MCACTAGRTAEAEWKQRERKELCNGRLFPEEEERRARSQARGGATGTEESILSQNGLEV